jgi:hypothetical protein
VGLTDIPTSFVDLSTALEDFRLMSFLVNEYNRLAAVTRPHRNKGKFFELSIVTEN